MVYEIERNLKKKIKASIVCYQNNCKKK
jgi:hypothetical protein